MEFKVSTTYTPMDFNAMMNCYTTLPQFKERLKGMRAVQWTGAVPIFLVGVMAMIYLLVMEFSVPVLLLGTVMFWLGLWVVNPNRTEQFGKKAWKSYPRKGQTIHFCFYDDYFEVETGDDTVRAYYSSLTCVLEDPERFYLCQEMDSIAEMLNKRDFVRGTPEQFHRFLEKRIPEKITVLS